MDEERKHKLQYLRDNFIYGRPITEAEKDDLLSEYIKAEIELSILATKKDINDIKLQFHDILDNWHSKI